MTNIEALKAALLSVKDAVATVYMLDPVRVGPLHTAIDHALSLCAALAQAEQPAEKAQPVGTNAERVAQLVRQLRNTNGGHINGLHDLMAADMLEEMAALADSEGTRAVNYLRRARQAEALLAAPPKAEQAQSPIGWLYDWTHSSALGRPDERYTGFTTDEKYARSGVGHENVRAVCAAPPAAPPKAERAQPAPTEAAIKRAMDDSGIAWLPVSTDDEAVGFVEWAVRTFAATPAAPQPTGPLDDFGRPIVYDTEAIDNVTHALTGDEGEDDSVTVLERFAAYVQNVWPGKPALQVLLEYEEKALAAAPQPQAAPMVGLTQAAQDVLSERRRQVEVEGWTPEHDDEHEVGQLAHAAACYTLTDLEVFSNNPPMFWPWSHSWWKPKDRRSNLIRAAALLLAEIERLDRAHGIHAQEGATQAQAQEGGR